MRICIIGPVTPFRSGIARHTTAIARELARRDKIDVSVLSFSRQYPRFLYPGDDDRDPEARPPDGIDIDFCLDSINPLSWLAAVRRLLRRPPDLVVIPAWTFFVAPCLGFVARTLRRHGIPISMIVHNAVDHESARWKTALSRFQLRQASRFMTHNASIAADLAKLVPETPVMLRSHPVYDDYPMPRGTLIRSAGLELLFFGLVRAYKGLDVALRAVAAAKVPDLRLSVVGEFWEALAETRALIHELDLNDRVELVPRYVSDQEAAEYFARSDAVVAPYRAATGSGVLALAQWYQRPVVASDVPGLADAVADGVTGWLFPAGDAAALAALLETSVTRESAAAMHTAIQSANAKLSWERFADALLSSPELRRFDG